MLAPGRACRPQLAGPGLTVLEAGSMRRTVRGLSIAAGLLAIAFATSTSSFGGPQVADASARMNRQTFHDQMRTLWGGDHIVWTRCFIISAGTLPDNLPDIGPTTDRLLDNQTAIGDAFKPFYGA